MTRLPQPGKDAGQWGDILNDFLAQSHTTDGSLKNGVVGAAQLQDNAVTETILSSAVQTKLNQPATITDGSVTKAKLTTSVQTTLDKADSALQTAPVTKVNNQTGDVTITKTDVGLSNVDNTADTAKPVSTAQQAALDLKADTTALTGKLNTSDLDAQTAAKITTDGTATQAALSSTYVARGAVGSLPAGLGWDTTVANITPSINQGVGSAGIAPGALFDTYSTARSAPGATFYVTPTGNDSNNGLTVGTAFRGLQKAVQAANAAAVPTKVIVTAGTYSRQFSLYFASVWPTVDIAFVTTGGRVNTGPYDLITPTADATYTSTYSQAIANCDRVLDTANPNRFGNYGELAQVATAATCNSTPGTWALVAGTLYIHRADGQPITTLNTRVFRQQYFNMWVRTPINVYMSGFDLEGSAGSAVALIDMETAASSAATKAVVFESCTFKYGGGAIGTVADGLAVISWNGIVAAFDSVADANAKDGFNFHNAPNVAPKPHALTVNCTGRDNGRGTSTSNQGLTAHDTYICVDIAGRYEANHGANFRSINLTRTYALGTVTRDDRGDIAMGGLVPPTGIRMDDTATLWAERVTVEQGRGQVAWQAANSGTRIYRRDCPPVSQADAGVGIFDTF